jgi:arylsulfatase A-like enzyme
VNVLLITIDSLNRHFLRAYGQPAEPRPETPNLDAFARRAAVFDRHYAGSLPCMPARREFMAGVQEFLWRGWGPIEPYDLHLAAAAARAGCTTQLITDHYHYWEHGAKGYVEDFHGWEFVRGHEFDPWKVTPTTFGSLELARAGVTADADPYRDRRQYLRNTAGFRREEDFFAPRVFSAAADWLGHARELPRWFLYVDSFEVHEPFDVPEPYRSLFTDESHDDPHLVYWPHPGHVSSGRSRLDERQVAYVRAQYAAKLVMTDRWFGRLFDQLDAQELWEDTVVIVTSDHGHFLGEHGWMGKPACPVYDVLAHTPLLIWDPEGVHGGRRLDALTQAVDVYATVLEALDAQSSAPHSRSLLPLLRGQASTHREVALYGYWGDAVNLTDGRHTYLRSPQAEGVCAYSTMMMRIRQAALAPTMRPDAVAGSFLPYTDGPVWRLPGPPEHRPVQPNRDLLFDIERDPWQEHDLHDCEPSLVARLERALAAALMELNAPEEQFARLGL